MVSFVMVLVCRRNGHSLLVRTIFFGHNCVLSSKMALFDPWNSVRKSKKEWEKVKWVRKSKIGEKKLLFLTDFTFSHSFCWTTEFDKVTPKVYETNVHFRRKYHLWYKKMTFFHSQWFHSGPGWPHFLTRAPLPSTRALVRKSGARTLVKSVSEKSPYFFLSKNILYVLTSHNNSS